MTIEETARRTRAMRAAGKVVEAARAVVKAAQNGAANSAIAGQLRQVGNDAAAIAVEIEGDG